MLWVGEGEAVPPPEYPTVVPHDETQPRVVEASMPSPTTMEIKTQNVKVLELNLLKSLESQGLSKGQIATYVANVAATAREFKFNLEVQAPFFLMVDVPKQWKVKGALVDGKPPNVYLYDPVDSVAFIGIVETASTVTVSLQLEPTAQSAANIIVSFTAGLMAIILIKSVAKKLVEAFKRR